MRIHHLNCGSSRPIGGQLTDGLSGTQLRGTLTTHCLLVEAPRGLVLVDTGYGLRDVAQPRQRLSGVIRTLLAPELREERTAVRQIERMGFDPRDVRDIVLTSLGFDHAGGIDDFPKARIHVMATELVAAEARHGLVDRMRYRPEQWDTHARIHTYLPSQGASFMDLGCVRGLDDLPEDLLLVPLVGHTLGHAGVAVRKDDGRWLLLAGDAYFYCAEIDLIAPHSTVGLRMYQALLDKDREARLRNQARLRELHRVHGAEVEIVCSHDVREFERSAGRRHETPPPILHRRARVRDPRQGYDPAAPFHH